MNFNKAIILGRLTRDPETKMLPSGQSVVSFGLATNRIFTDQSGNKQEFVEYHNVVAFGKLADICSRYLSKGGLVLIEGRIQTRSWQGQDGIKRNRTEIVAENMQLGPRKIAPEMPSLQKTEKPAAEEIPVIEQEAPITSEESTESEEPTESEESTESKKSTEEEEIKVENIPF